jgi:hypothetical protein
VAHREQAARLLPTNYLLHYDGHIWQQVNVPSSSPSYVQPYGFVGKDWVWVTGGGPNIPANLDVHILPSERTYP